MTKDRLQYLLNRYLTNTATEEELQEYAHWYRRQGEEGRKLFEEMNAGEAIEYKSDLFRLVMNNIQFVEYERKEQQRKRRLLYIKIAVAALVVITGTFVLYDGLTSKPETVAHNEPIVPVLKEQVIAVRNKTGSNTAVHLQDGSEVELSAGSELKYAVPFSTTHRQVYLSGKGFFKVAKDTNRPFTVYSHNIATTALGTTFTITAWPGKNDVLVALHTGKVVVQPVAPGDATKMKAVYLAPGQQLTCNITTGKATLHKPGAKEHIQSLGSRTGLALTFTDEPVINVFNAIEKGYAVHLKYDKEAFNDMIFTGRIREKDSLSQVLQRISILYNLNIKETGNRFIIQKSH